MLRTNAQTWEGDVALRVIPPPYHFQGHTASPRNGFPFSNLKDCVAM